MWEKGNTWIIAISEGKSRTNENDAVIDYKIWEQISKP